MKNKRSSQGRKRGEDGVNQDTEGANETHYFGNPYISQRTSNAIDTEVVHVDSTISFRSNDFNHHLGNGQASYNLLERRGMMPTKCTGCWIWALTG